MSGRKRKRVWLAIAPAVAVVATALGPAPAARATATLVCEANDPQRPADGEIHAVGSHEHWVLQQDVFIPEHGNRCPQTVGKLGFTSMPEPSAISALQSRQPWAPFIGLNQPLSASDWALAVTSSNNPALDASVIWHLPLMIDGFVVTANVPCTRPVGATVTLTSLTLSLIYSGVVTRWNDRALVEHNPWLASCGAPIRVGVRQDASWSNAVLKDYLSKQNPLFVPLKERDRLDEWPATLFPACGGSNENHMVSCSLLSGGISYMRHQTALANGLSPVLLTNGSGATPPPTLNPSDLWPSGCLDAVPNSITEPRTYSPAGFALDWSTFSMTNGTGYPLCGFGYVVSLTDHSAFTVAQRDAWRDHFKVMWSNTAQDWLKDYGYAPLPGFLADNVRASVPLTP